MVTQTTNGITISAEASYQPEHSRPLAHKHVFSYRIRIDNHGLDTVQLLRRHWHIVDSNGVVREVEGEGVVGAQPVLLPSESYQYTSWCPLMTEMGKMYGTFLMEKEDGSTFYARIPEFKLIAPQKLS